MFISKEVKIVAVSAPPRASENDDTLQF